MAIDLKGRRIALIGGAGFIGHNLALLLSRWGADVQIIDALTQNNLLSFAYKMPDLPQADLYRTIVEERLELLGEVGVPLHKIDARDYHGLSRILDEIKPQDIVHLAAISHAGRSNKDPYSTFDNSLVTLENALDAARGLDVEHFIYFSSSMAYGNFLTEEVSEDHPLNPVGIYGALKVAGEKMVIAYQQVFGLPYTILRPSALYGPRCVSRRVGQIFIENALNGATIRVDGDGEEKLDFTYIDDLAEGVRVVIENSASHNEIFNMTYGRSRSIQDLLSILSEHFGDVDLQYVERDELMPFRGTLSVDKARNLLGYNPVNSLEIGFPKYIQWYRDLWQAADSLGVKGGSQ